jgi:hypothetical protein
MNLSSPVTLSNDNAHSRFRPSLDSGPATSVRQRPADAPRRPIRLPTAPRLLPLAEWRP